MMARVLTAIVLGALLIGALFFTPPAVGVGLVAAFVLMGAREWALFAGWREPLARYGYVLVVGALCWLAWRWCAGEGNLAWLLALSVLWWFGALAWVLRAPVSVPPLAAALAGAWVLVPTGLVLMRLIAHTPRGAEWALFVLALAFVTDIGALFAGRSFGRLKLAPRVSPGKTWEGVVGGVLCAGLLAVMGAHWFALPVVVFLPLCLAASALSVVGDLTESLLKRGVGLKDSGHLFPGHGGVLDRIDSATAATPVMALGLLWLGVPL